MIRKRPVTSRTAPSRLQIEGPKNRLAEIPWEDQESQESGLVSSEKNRIVEEHARMFPEGDPSVRRIHPSRDVVERNYRRLSPGSEACAAIPDFFETVETRHSVRTFRDCAVDEERLERILVAANNAPSAGDLQAYQIVLVRDPKRKRALAAAAQQEFIATAPAVLVFCADPERASHKYGARGRRLYCVQDATIAAAYAQLAASAIGVGSVWVGAFDEDAVAKVVGGLWPVCLMPLGYAAEIPEASTRRPIDELIHLERL